MILVGRPGEQRTAGIQFCHDTSGRPDINARVIRSAAQQHVRSTIPQCHHFVREGVDRDAESTGQTEVAQLELPLLINEEILRLEVSMENPILMTKGDALEELVHE